MNSIRFTKGQLDELKRLMLIDLSRESAAFLLAGVFENSRGVHFVVREVVGLSADAYEIQESFSLQISPKSFNRVIGRAEEETLAVVLCHSHPFSEADLNYSLSDDHGEAISAKTLHQCLEGRPVGSLLFGRSGITGRIWLVSESMPVPLHEMRELGRHFRITALDQSKTSRDRSIDALYSRQVLAFGEQGQRFLETLKVGIVGLGGTGSCVAEDLARMGISDFVLVDNDSIEPSNITRVYGTTYRDVTADKPRAKTLVARNNIKRIRPTAKVKAHSFSVLNPKAIRSLKDCDLIFSCTDRHTPRSIVGEMSYQYHIPVIDVGAGLNRVNDSVSGGTVRASIVGPGLPCLFCQRIIRPDMIAAENLPERERARLQSEGYIPGLSEAPSLIGFTTMAASLGVNLFLDLLFDFMNDQATTFLIEFNPFGVTKLYVDIQEDCACILRLGRGDYFPLSLA